MHASCTYTDEMAELILAELRDGRSLNDVCSDDDKPPRSTVRQWVKDDRNGFAAKYAQAREIGYHHMADDVLDIADNGMNDWMERRGQEDAGWQANGEHIQRSRLRVDTRKWMLSKVLPKIYGDKMRHVGDADDDPIKLDASPSDRLAEFLNSRSSQSG